MSDLILLSFDELLAKKKAHLVAVSEIDVELEDRREAQILELQAEFRAQAGRLGIPLEKLLVNPNKSPAKGTKGIPKYRDPATGATWTGKGKKPGWVNQYLANGGTLDTLLIAA